MSDSRAFDRGDLAGGAGTQPEALEWNQALTTQLRAHQAMWIINKTPGLMTSPRESQKKRGPWTRHDYLSFFFLLITKNMFSIENRNKQKNPEIIQDPSRKIIKICVVVLPCSNTGSFRTCHIFFFY